MAHPGYLSTSNFLVSASWPFTFPSVSLSFTHIFHLTSTCFYSSSPHQSIPPPVQTPFHLLLTLTIDQVVWKHHSPWTLDWPDLICQPVCLSPLRTRRGSELIHVILATPWPICDSYPTPCHCPAVQYQTYILFCHSWLHNAVPEFLSWYPSKCFLWIHNCIWPSLYFSNHFVLSSSHNYNDCKVVL